MTKIDNDAKPDAVPEPEPHPLPQTPSKTKIMTGAAEASIPDSPTRTLGVDREEVENLYAKLRNKLAGTSIPEMGHHRHSGRAVPCSAVQGEPGQAVGDCITGRTVCKRADGTQLQILRLRAGQAGRGEGPEELECPAHCTVEGALDADRIEREGFLCSIASATTNLAAKNADITPRGILIDEETPLPIPREGTAEQRQITSQLLLQVAYELNKLEGDCPSDCPCFHGAE